MFSLCFQPFPLSFIVKMTFIPLPKQRDLLLIPHSKLQSQIQQNLVKCLSNSKCAAKKKGSHSATVAMNIHYRPQRSCGQGNIFTPVCHSVHSWGSASVHAGIPPLGADTPPRDQTPPGPDPSPPEQTPPQDQTPPGSRLQHTVYERPVRILLECILVNFQFLFQNFPVLPT